MNTSKQPGLERLSPQPLRQITGYLYLFFAALLGLGQSEALFVGRSWGAGSIAINFILAVAAALAGIALLKLKGRLWLWLAVFVAGLGLFKTNLWELLLVGQIGRLRLSPFNYEGPLWMTLISFATHFLLPVMLFLSIVLLFQATPAAVPAAAPATLATLPPGFTALPPTVARRRPIFGVLSLVFPALGIPLVLFMVSMSLAPGNDWDTGLALQLVTWLLYMSGFISAMVAFIRWERRLILPLLGFILNAAPFLVLLLMASQGSLAFSGPTIFGILFCAACAITSIKTGERGRNWSLLAAIPSVFAILALLEPALNIFIGMMGRR